MTEAAFARTFLGTIDSRPVRLSADHAEDPKSFPARAPVSAFHIEPASDHTLLTHDVVHLGTDAHTYE